MAGGDLEHVFQQILETEAKAERQRAEIDATKAQLCTCEEEIRQVSEVLRVTESDLAQKRRLYVSLCVDRDCAEVRRTALVEQARSLRLVRDDAARLLVSIRERRFSAYREFCRQAETFEERYGLNEACRLKRAAELRSRTALLEATRQKLLLELRQCESEEAHQLELMREISLLEVEVSRLNAQATGVRCQLERTRSMIADAEKEKLVEISKYQRLQADVRPKDDHQTSVRRCAVDGHFEIELEEDDDDCEGSRSEMQPESAAARPFSVAARHESMRLREKPISERFGGRLSQPAATQLAFATRATCAEAVFDHHGEEQPPVARIHPMTASPQSYLDSSGWPHETASQQETSGSRMRSNKH